MLTKKPTGPVTVQLNTSNNAKITIQNPSVTFTPSNWQIPQRIQLSGCMLESIDLTFTAKANNEGGFKGTESDSLTIRANNKVSCEKASNGMPTNQKAESKNPEAHAVAETIPSEIDSPFFLILRILFQPFLGIASIIQGFFPINPKTPSVQTQPSTKAEAEAETLPNILFTIGAEIPILLAPRSHSDWNHGHQSNTYLLEQEASFNSQDPSLGPTQQP